MPQPSGSTPPNASGALAMSQHLWHRTVACLLSLPLRALCPFRPLLIPDLEPCSCHPWTMIHSASDHDPFRFGP
jgi:hypothetical protein